MLINTTCLALSGSLKTKEVEYFKYYKSLKGKFQEDTVFNEVRKRTGFYHFTSYRTICNHRTEYTIIVLPDTQYYCAFHPEMFYSQIKWILENKKSIDFVIHLGDVVQNYDNEKQWQIAQLLLSKLYKQIPLLIIPGNHDCQGDYNKQDWSFFQKYISPKTSDFDFVVNGKDSLLIMGLEWNPNSDILHWADSILTVHSNLSSIFFTHEYLDTNAIRSEMGERIWEKVISKHENIILVLNGHFFGVAEKTDYINNKPIAQHLFNFQHEYYGNGWLRIYKIKGNRITLMTYSPYLNKYR